MRQAIQADGVRPCLLRMKITTGCCGIIIAVESSVGFCMTSFCGSVKQTQDQENKAFEALSPELNEQWTRGRALSLPNVLCDQLKLQASEPLRKSGVMKTALSRRAEAQATAGSSDGTAA